VGGVVASVRWCAIGVLVAAGLTLAVGYITPLARGTRLYSAPRADAVVVHADLSGNRAVDVGYAFLDTLSVYASRIFRIHGLALVVRLTAYAFANTGAEITSVAPTTVLVALANRGRSCAFLVLAHTVGRRAVLAGLAGNIDTPSITTHLSWLAVFVSGAFWNHLYTLPVSTYLPGVAVTVILAVNRWCSWLAVVSCTITY